MTEKVSALPTKQFFIDSIVRDITLEDAVLDLADNSVDSLVRVYGLDVTANLLKERDFRSPRANSPGLEDIRIEITDESFSITDICGGIDIEHAKSNVFRFGRPQAQSDSALGVYGIGLKRAMFKIGKAIVIESYTLDSGFRIQIDVEEWAKDDTNWEFSLEPLPPAESLASSGTTIKITQLNEEVLLRLQAGGFRQRLSDALSTTYALFLERFLTISLDGKAIDPSPFPIAGSADLPPGHKTLEWDDVKLELFTGLGARDDDEWARRRAGWYVLCNGRVVVTADKTELTGWGLFGPTFHTKYRGFVGVAFFFSQDPTSLPWTTTKRGINIESRVYQLARKEMALVSRPVISFLNKMYPTEATEEIPERELAEKIRKIPVDELAATLPEPFKSPDTTEVRKRRESVSVQYPALWADINRIKKHLTKPNWSASRVGRHTFEYFLRMELPE